VPLGDIGLLASEVFPYEDVIKTHKLGFIPHYVHQQDMDVRDFFQRNEDIKYIDICGRIEDVFREINECENIISSSLHGIIFADSFEIPSGWAFVNDDIAGGTFKFRDYFSIFGIYDPVPILFNSSLKTNDILDFCLKFRPGLDQIKEDLVDSFPKELLEKIIVDEEDEENAES